LDNGRLVGGLGHRGGVSQTHLSQETRSTSSLPMRSLKMVALSRGIYANNCRTAAVNSSRLPSLGNKWP
jgi:hypothetical protein